MTRREKILGKLGKLGSEALVSATHLRREVEALGMDRMEHLAKRLKLVTREEFDQLRAMVKETRAIQEQLMHRLSQLDRDSKPVKRPASRPRRAKRKN